MGNQTGKYQQQNQGGKPKKNVHWKSAERPSPPGRPMLITPSEQQPDVVNLRWERPKIDGGSPITGYIVEHRRMGSPHWVRATPTPVTICEVSISGLEPGWRYQFRAFAENIVGRSEPSELSDALTVTLQRNAISVPRFIDELEDMQAVEDERIEFRVRILGQPQPEINWFKDGYEIFSSRRTKIVNDNDVSVLVIHQVALTDEGEIRCTATNRAGHVVTKAQLLVQAPPKIRLPRTYEDGLIVEADEMVRLKVGIAGQPMPMVVWLHEGEVVQTGGRFEIINTDKNSLLKIDNIQREDRGEYGIRASNRLGDDVTSFLVTVTARPNPPGKVRLNMSFGKSATLSWTSPIDDGGCKIGNYIVEYFRVGWNVWLKAATTRSLSTTLHDLIEGSEYKFRVKAENPYGLSDPSEESEVLFIPDPKRGITSPKSATKLAEAHNQPLPPRRKTLSPTRPPQQDAATETVKHASPNVARKVRPQLLDNEDLHREMNYGTPDKVLQKDMQKTASMINSEAAQLTNKPKLSLNIKADTSPSKSPQRSPQRSPIVVSRSPQPLPVAGEKGTLFLKSLLRPRLATPERSATPEVNEVLNQKPSLMPVAPVTNESLIRKRSLTPVTPDTNESPNRKRSLTPVTPDTNELQNRKRSLTPVTPDTNDSLNRKHSLTPVTPIEEPRLQRKSLTPEPARTTAALERSTEPVDLEFNQHVRRYSNHTLSQAKDVPALAIAIALGNMGMSNNNMEMDNKTNRAYDDRNEYRNNENKNNGNNSVNNGKAHNKNGNSGPNRNGTSHNTNGSKNDTAAGNGNGRSNNAYGNGRQHASTITNPTIHISAPPATLAPDRRSPSPPVSPLSATDKHDDVHTSNEFMLVVFDKNSKVKDKDKQDSFELDLEDALQPPPISISSPDLASLEFTNLHSFPLRRSVSSTELLYERAMARFYEAVELEEAEKARKLKIKQDKTAIPSNAQAQTVRKRLGSITEAERLSFERRSELRRQSADLAHDFKLPTKWSSRDNISVSKPLSRTTDMLGEHKQQESQETYELSDLLQTRSAPNKTDSYDLGSDYTESTESSEEDSIEKFKMELMARTHSPSPRELDTYHPSNMAAGTFTPYRAPTPEQAAVVLNRPLPLPSPDFVPKPILKRSSNENMVLEASPPPMSSNPGHEKTMNLAEGIKSFFKRDKKSTTEKNTEDNENISRSKQQTTAEIAAAEVETKRRTKEDEERKRKEAERIMLEESKVAADHYSELVAQVSSTHKYHTPLYLDRDELKKAAERAAKEGGNNTADEDDDDYNAKQHLNMRRAQSPELATLKPPKISDKPRLSISERGQMKHVRETSNLALIEPKAQPKPAPDTPSETESTPSVSVKSFAKATPATPPAVVSGNDEAGYTTIISETYVERPDARGRTRLVKVKRIVKKRMASSTRSREPSSSRPAEEATVKSTEEPPLRRRIASRTRSAVRGESKSPGPLGRRPLKRADSPSKESILIVALSNGEMLEVKSADQMSEEAHEKVRSAVSYSTDLVLFVVACYVYLFKDARLVLPILALLIYRQLGEAISANIPHWMKRKKD